jgi:hypothetical protein
MFAFIFLTIIFIPVMGLYVHGGNYEFNESYGLSQLTLGNLGQRESICQHQYT